MDSIVVKFAIFCLFYLTSSAIAGAQNITNLLKTRESLHAQYEALQEGKKTIWGNLPKKRLEEQLSTLVAITVTDSAIIKALWQENEQMSANEKYASQVSRVSEQSNNSGQLENNRTAAALAHYILLANKRELKLLQTENHYQEKLDFFQNLTAIITIISVLSIAFHCLQIRKYFGGA